MHRVQVAGRYAGLGRTNDALDAPKDARAGVVALTRSDAVMSHATRYDYGEKSRHRIPLPLERRQLQPFVLDSRAGRVIAPWPRKRAQPGDEERLDATLARIDGEMLPALVCWCWPDRDPEPVRDMAPDWLRHWSRDRAVYVVER
jgi:hypothetical protein